MPTSSSAFVTYIGEQIGYAWAWGLAVAAVLFLFALGSGALKSGLRAVLRHARGFFRL